MTSEPAPMHIFYVQSQLSLFVCRAIVGHKEIRPEDALFMLDRGLEPNNDDDAVVIPEYCKRIRPSVRGILDNRRALARSRRFLNEVTRGRPFEFYTNRMNHSANDVFIRMPTLQAVNFYEEGFAAYYVGLSSPNDARAKEPSFRERMVYALSGIPAPVNTDYYPDIYKHIYGTCEQAFRDFPRRVEVDLKSAIAAKTGNARFDHIVRGATVFVLPLPHAFLADPLLEKNLEDAVVCCIQSSGSKIYFKFHPDRNDHSDFWGPLCARIRARTGCDIQARSVPDLPLEVIATSRPDIILAVVVSSLSVYSRLFKCRVLSFAKMVYGENHWKVQHLVPNSPGTIFAEPGDDASAIATRLNSAPPAEVEAAGEDR